MARTSRYVKWGNRLLFKTSIRASAVQLLKDIGEANDITFVRLRGNIGDHLIWAGARQLLRPMRYREVAAEDLGDAGGELAVMAGCGGWCEPFHGLAPDTLVELESRFERVVVLPSTFDADFPLTREVLTGSSARVYARERISYQGIAPLCNAGIAPDCAYFFDYRPYQRRGNGTLYAYRTDAESAVDWKSRGGFPSTNVDISSRCSTLDEWLWTIARHREIWTDRAHVMIAGAMLGKTVYYSSTIYHKVPAIAEYSLRRFPVLERLPSTA